MNFARNFKCSQFIFSPVIVDDAESLFDAVISPQFPAELPLHKLTTISDARSWCAERAEDWNSGVCFVWTCRSKNNADVIGQVTIFPQQDRLALAYWIHPKYWGQGFATQMCESLLSHLRICGFRGEIWAGIHSWNAKSESVIRKLGFKQILKQGELTTKEYNLVIV